MCLSLLKPAKKTWFVYLYTHLRPYSLAVIHCDELASLPSGREEAKRAVKIKSVWKPRHTWVHSSDHLAKRLLFSEWTHFNLPCDSNPINWWQHFVRSQVSLTCIVKFFSLCKSFQSFLYKRCSKILNSHGAKSQGQISSEILADSFDFFSIFQRHEVFYNLEVQIEIDSILLRIKCTFFYCLFFPLSWALWIGKKSNARQVKTPWLTD